MSPISPRPASRHAHVRPRWHWLALASTLAFGRLGAVDVPTIQSVAPVGGELQIKFASPTGFNAVMEQSADLIHWQPVYTFPRSAATQTYTDVGARFDALRYYRVVQSTETNALTGDHLHTSEGDVVIHPVNHASFVMTWKDQVIYADPVGGAALYKSFPRPTLVLVTDIHGDHLDSVTLNGIAATNATLIVPPAVLPMMSAGLKAAATTMTNGATLSVLGLRVDTIPMYNTTSGRTTYHTKGRGNGYILTLGDRRIYISGDTEDIPEMLALTDIDAAFLCMNLPFTMDIPQAANAAKTFLPRTVYPYHYSGSDPTQFKKLVGTNVDVEVRLRKWY